MAPERFDQDKYHYNGTGITHQDNSLINASPPELKKRKKGARAVGAMAALALLAPIQANTVYNRTVGADKKTAIIASAGIYYRNTALQPVPRLDSPPATVTTFPQIELLPATKQTPVESPGCNDGWEELRESVCFTKFREYDSDIYVVRVDLKDPNVSVRPSFAAEPGRLGRLSDGAQRQGAIAAINASFFRDMRPLGPIAVDGRWLHTDPSPQQVLIVNNDNTAHLVPTKQALKEDPAQMKFALSGSHTLIQNGIATNDFGPDNRDCILNCAHPRTTIGVNKNGYFYMIAVDGKGQKSRGVTMPELKTIMFRMGILDAIALDGGRSTGFYAKGGILNTPSKGPTNISTILGVYAK